MKNWITKHQTLILWLVGGAALLLRWLYFTWQNVPALNQDEAALLLNARFLSQAGVDEWGESWPVVFRSFGDYKLPGYIYATTLIGQVVGFGSGTIRVLSFGAGLLNLGLVFWLAQQLWRSRLAGWLTTLLLFASAWSWHYSSVGFEANVGLSFFLLALVATLSHRVTWWSGLVTGLAIFLGGLTYNSPLLLSPLLLLSAWLRHWPQRRALVSLTVVIVVAAMAVAILTLPATQQKQGISILSDPTLQAEYPAYRQQFSPNRQKILGNRYVYYGQAIGQRVLKSFDWEFLVTRGGGNPWHTIPGTGHLHFFIPLLAASGLGWLVRWLREPSRRRQALLLLGLVFGSLAPAAITVDAPHATRSLFFFVMLTVVAGGTWASLQRRLVHSSWRRVVLVSFLGLVAVGWLWWWVPARDRWHEQLDVDRRWYVGLESALQSLPPDSQPVYIYDPAGVLYPRVALMLQLEPAQFLATVQRSAPDTAGLVRVEKLGRYRFVPDQPLEVKGYYLRPTNGQGWAMIEL